MESKIKDAIKNVWRSIVEGYHLLRILTLTSEEQRRLHDCPTERKPIYMDVDNPKPTLMISGIKALARLSAPLALWHPVLILDVQLNNVPSRAFATFTYIFDVILAIWSLYISRIVLAYSAESNVPAVAGGVGRSLIAAILISEMIFPITAVSCAAWLTYNRCFISDFFYYDCSFISVPNDFQIKTVYRTFIVLIGLAFMIEPLFVSAIVFDDIQKKTLLPDGPTYVYICYKTFLAIHACWGSLILATFEQIMVCIPCFLSECLNTYLEKSFSKHLSRGRIELPRESGDSLGEEDYYLCKQYGITTLQQGWPGVNQRQAKRVEYRLREEPATRDEVFNEEELKSIYTNLTNTLSKVVIAIRKYEKSLSYIHLILVCQSGFIIATWILVSVVNMRFSIATKKGGQSASVFTTLNVRITITMLSYLLMNWVSFHRFSRLRVGVDKLMSRLFKKNVACLLESPEESSGSCGSIWSYYDRLKSVGDRVGFRFTSNTLYSKHCVMLVCARAITLTLIYVQVFDLYTASYTKLLVVPGFNSPS